MFFINFFVHMKMVNEHYQKNKERLRKEPYGRYQNLFEEEKDKRWKKVWDMYQNLTEEQKQNLLLSIWKSII